MSVSKNIFVPLVVFLCSSVFHLSYAQPQHFYFNNYGVKDGLSYGLVNDVFRDSEGFLWIATFNGLNRFDGNSFRIFYANPHDSTAIISGDVLRICEDRDGNIWCGTNKGVSCYNKLKGSFSNYQLSNPFGFALSSNWVNEILCDRYGTIWCGTRAGIFEYDKMQDRFVGYYHDDNNPASPTNHHVYKNSFAEDPVRDGIWFSGKAGINFLDTKRKVFYNYKNNPENLPLLDSNFTYPLCIDGKGNLWYVPRSANQMRCYNLSNHSITSTDLITDDPGKPPIDVQTIFIDSKQQQWISTWYHPMFFKSQHDTIYRRFSHDESLNYSIGSDFFWDVMEDNDGTLWFGGISGISKLEPSRQYYYLLKPNVSLPFSSQFHDIICLYQQNDRVLWLGTDSGLYSFDISDLSCIRYRMDGGAGLNAHTNAIAKIDSVLWLATYSGMKFFDLRTRHFITKTGLPDELRTKPVLSTYAGMDGIIWVTDDINRGLYQFNKATKRWKKFQHDPRDPHSVSSEVHGPLFQDDKGKTWFGSTQDGLMRYDEEHERFDYFKTGNAGNRKEKIIQVKGICPAGKNELYLLSSGLYKYNYHDSSLKIWQQADGLAADANESMLKDHYGNLWLAGYQDATVLIERTNEIKKFRFEYSANNYHYPNSSTPLLNGKICISIRDALAICDPDVMQDTQHVFFPVLISDFSVFEKSIPFSQKQADIKLNYKQNFFSISFSSFSHDVQYAYKLEGFDQDWVHSGSRKFAAYTNVPGGDYTFFVKAGTNGKWSEPTQIYISVVPPFWKTTWFAVVAILTFSGLVFLVFRIRVQNIKKQQEEKLKLYYVRDKIARDLHDDVGASLSSIRMYSEAIRSQVKEKIPQADFILGRMSDNAREIVENMSDIVWAINPQNDSLQFMEDRMRAFVSAVCSSKNIVPHFNRIDFHELRLPMEMRKNIFLIFKEAVNNAAKYSGCKNLVMNLDKSEDKLKLTIGDDGTGFDEAKTTLGNGLTSMKKRADEIGGDLCIHSETGEGTTIVLSIPLP